VCHNLSLPFSFSYCLCLCPTPPKKKQGPHSLRNIADSIVESHYGLLSLFRPAALQRPSTALFLALFKLLRRRLHRLECFYWSVLLFGLLLLVGTTIYDYCVMGSEAFFPAMYSLVVLTTPCYASQASQNLSFCKDILKDLCISFLIFYSFHTTSLIIVKSNNLLKNLCLSFFILNICS
jgi:hypothetical protein